MFHLHWELHEFLSLCSNSWDHRPRWNVPEAPRQCPTHRNEPGIGCWSSRVYVWLLLVVKDWPTQSGCDSIDMFWSKWVFFQISSDWHSGKCDEKHEFNSITFPLFQSISQKKLAPFQLSATPWRARPLWDKSTAFHAADPRRTWGPVVDAPR